MGDSIFCTELNDACENSAAEDQLMWNKETLAQFAEFVKCNGNRKLWRKKRKNRKNRKLKRANKVLRKDYKHLKAENEALRQEIASREEERGKTQSATGGSATCSDENQRKTLFTEMKVIFLKSLPKLFNTAVRVLVTTFAGWFSVWLGKRTGELCTWAGRRLAVC